jgi:uncharacterized protein (TIGR01777 family)
MIDLARPEIASEEGIMKVAIAGATGLIGQALLAALRADGNEVVALSRAEGTIGDIETTLWDPRTSALPEQACDGVDAFVNLAGVGIGDGRWNERHRTAIVGSRVLTTKRLVAATHTYGIATLINASAIGFYGPGDDSVDETSPPGSDFLASVCVKWEDEATKAGDSARVVLLRTGIVLSNDGGALPKLLVPARLGLGGPLGGGKQWQSWIHIADEVGLILRALSDTSLSGPLNATAPNPVRQVEFAHTLGRVLGRPAVIPTPGLAVRLLLGKAGDIALTGQCVMPSAALRSGYEFEYPLLEPALRNLLDR